MNIDNIARILVINNSVRTKCVATNINHLFKQPNMNSVRKLKQYIVKVITSFPTTLFGGRFRHLALALIKDQMRRVTGNASLDCSYLDKLDQVNPDIKDVDAGKVLLTKQEDQKKTLAAWHLCKIINEVDIEHMAAMFELYRQHGPRSQGTVAPQW